MLVLMGQSGLAPKPVRQPTGGTDMSQETLATAAAIGTFIVIAATAIAAVVQLRHLRAQNQLTGLLTVLARVEDPQFNEWVDGAQALLTSRLPEPRYRRAILDGTYERKN